MKKILWTSFLFLACGCQTRNTKKISFAAAPPQEPFVVCAVRSDCEKNRCLRERPHECYVAPSPYPATDIKFKPGDSIDPTQPKPYTPAIAPWQPGGDCRGAPADSPCRRRMP